MTQVLWTPGMTLDEVERLVIEAAFRYYRGNKTATAAALGISVRTLDNKFEKYQADDDAREMAAAERQQQHEAFLARARGAIGVPVGTPAEIAVMAAEEREAALAAESAAPAAAEADEAPMPAIPPPASASGVDDDIFGSAPAKPQTPRRAKHDVDALTARPARRG